MRHLFDGCEKPVSAARQRLDKGRIVGGVAERFSKPGDDRVQAVVEVDECFAAPDVAPQFLARDDVPRMLDERQERLKRLLLEALFDAAALELAGAGIQLERAETKAARGRSRVAGHTEAIMRAHAQRGRPDRGTIVGSRPISRSTYGFCQGLAGNDVAMSMSWSRRGNASPRRGFGLLSGCDKSWRMPAPI